MKAAYINRHGDTSVFEFGDYPDPKPKSGNVIIDIHAASVNAIDWKVRKGQALPDKTFPYIVGRDFSGVVREIGDDVDDVQPRDTVWGVCAAGQEGTYAEQIAVQSEIVANKPDSMSHVEAAALSLIGITAMAALEESLKLAAGETILIHGGAGGVAGFAIQLAKHIGAHVITTASPDNHDYVRDLGADHVIDYRSQDFREQVGDCDAVLDTVGREVAMQSFEVLKPGGRLASIAAGQAPLEPPSADLTYVRPQVGRGRPQLDRIAQLVEAGAVRAPEIQTFALSDAGKAHTISEGRHFRGKLVLEIR